MLGSTHIKKNCLNLGIARKGGGGSRLAQIAWSTFLLKGEIV